MGKVVANFQTPPSLTPPEGDVSFNSINNTPIGGVTPSSGAFTTLSASTSATLPQDTTVGGANVANALASRSLAQGLILSGSQGRVYSNPALGQVAGAKGVVVWVDVPTVNPTSISGVFCCTLTGAASGAGALNAFYNGGTSDLIIDLNAASGYRRATITGFRATYSGKRVPLRVELGAASPVFKAFNTTLTYTETTGGTPPAWTDVVDMTYVDFGALGSSGYPSSGFIRGAAYLGSLTDAEWSAVVDKCQYPSWWYVSGGAGTAKYTSSFISSIDGWGSNSPATITTTYNETIGAETGCWKGVTNAGGVYQIRRTTTLAIGAKYRVTGKAYLSSASTAYIRAGAYGAARDSAGFALSNGNWVTFSLSYSVTQSDTTGYLMITGSSVSDIPINLTNGDYLALKDVVWTYLGCVCEMDPLWNGLGTVYPDSSGAGRNFTLPSSGAVPAIVGRRNPTYETVTTTGNATVGGTLGVTGATTISSATASTSPSTGALVVAGGAGIGGALNVGGVITHAGTFAGIHVHDASTAQTIATGTAYAKITAFTDNDPSNDCTADAANDKITITRAGVYKVGGSASFYSDTNNVTWKATAFLDGVEQDNVHWECKIGTGADLGNASFSGFIDVTSVPVDLDLRMRHDQGGDVALTITYSNLNVSFEGNT